MAIGWIRQAPGFSGENNGRINKSILKPGPLQEHPVRLRRRILAHTLAGALFGITILHPLSMIAHDFYGLTPGAVLDALAKAFTFEHFPMAVFFVLIGGLFGAIHGTYIHIITRLNQEIHRLAITDELTSLYNRHFFMNRLDHEMERGRRYQRSLSLMMIDLDDFKNYNDTHGHQLGDRLLQDLTRCFRKLIRKTDVAARYGGEEFVILMPETVQEMAVSLAKRICVAVADYPFIHGETQPLGRVTISVGVAEFPSEADSTDSLIRKADQALYRAKEKGKNRVCQGGGNINDAVLQ